MPSTNLPTIDIKTSGNQDPIRLALPLQSTRSSCNDCGSGSISWIEQATARSPGATCAPVPREYASLSVAAHAPRLSAAACW